MLFTLKDVVDFIVKHKGSRAYINNSYSDIAHDIIKAAAKNKLLLAESPDGKELWGVAVIAISEHNKVIIVSNIVCIKGGFKVFIKEGIKKYENYKICGYRRGRLITFTKDNLWEAARQKQRALQKCLQD